MTMDELGKAKEKMRLTYDCSWPGPLNQSINSRIDEDLLAPLQYVRCLFRVLHRIQHMRLHNPSRRILLAKHDLDSAYRRLHWHAKCAIALHHNNNRYSLPAYEIMFRHIVRTKWVVFNFGIYGKICNNFLINDKSWNPQKLFNPRKEIPITTSSENDSIKQKGAKQVMFKLPKNQT